MEHHHPGVGTIVQPTWWVQCTHVHVVHGYLNRKLNGNTGAGRQMGEEEYREREGGGGGVEGEKEGKRRIWGQGGELQRKDKEWVGEAKVEGRGGTYIDLHNPRSC